MTSTLDQDLLAAVFTQCASFNLRKASRLVSQMFDEALAPVGLRSTQVVMLVVIGRRGPVSMTELARELILTPSTLSRNIRPLERAGYIRIEAADMRRKTVTLTPKGEEILLQCVPLWTEVQTKFLEGIGAETWNTLLSNLNHLTSALHSTEDNTAKQKTKELENVG